MLSFVAELAPVSTIHQNGNKSPKNLTIFNTKV